MMKRLNITVIALCILASASAQEKPLDLGLETRTSFSTEGKISFDYFAIYAKGTIADGFSYYFYGYPNRIPTSTSYFDALAWGMLSYAPSRNWNFEIGKQALEYAGNEYDYKPIDVFTPSEYWHNYAAFQLALTGQYILDSGDKFSIQAGESPFSKHSAGNTLYSFSASARGSHDSFGYSASANFLEYSRGEYAAHQALSGWAYMGPLKLELDVINRADAGHMQILKDFSVVSQAILTLGKGVQIFARYSKDQNFSDDYFDTMVYRGEDVSVMTEGIMWRPESAEGRVRFHLYYTSVSGKESPLHSSVKVGSSSLNFGATWDIKFIKR